jgi:hypothetical protein
VAYNPRIRETGKLLEGDFHTIVHTFRQAAESRSQDQENLRLFRDPISNQAQCLLDGKGS